MNTNEFKLSTFYFIEFNEKSKKVIKIKRTENSCQNQQSQEISKNLDSSPSKTAKNTLHLKQVKIPRTPKANHRSENKQEIHQSLYYIICRDNIK